MNDSPLLLAGDIGGTKTWLRLGFERGGRVETVRDGLYRNGDYAGLGAVVGDFLKEGSDPPATACFAVAGPVAGRRVRLTNLPWEIDADAVAAEFGIARVRLVNDFEAVGHGIGALAQDDLLTLQAGDPVDGAVRAVIGAGTGLGMAMLVPDGARWRVLPSEGGHADFGPGDERQIGLLRFLADRFGHVSWERVVSGPGLVALYEYLRHGSPDRETAELREAARTGDAAAAISRFAGSGDALCAEALDLFVAAYGAAAGNLALVSLARGGVFVAGGIAARITERLAEGGFLRAFLAKGRYEDLLRRIPLHVVTNPRVGLMGAAQVAAGLCAPAGD